MKKTVFFLFALVCMMSVSYAATHNICKAPAGTVYNHPSGYVPHLNGPSEILITHSTNQSITPGNSASCNNGVMHADNSYYRIFDLKNDFSISENFNVTHVEVGIESALGATGTQPVTVRLYTLNGPLVNANLSLLYSQTYSVPDQTLSIYNFEFTTPVFVPKNKVLVVEIFTPDGISTGNSFFIGSNITANTFPSYLAATDCGINEPATVASLGFPGMNIVMNVYGANAIVPIPYGVIASAFLLIAVGLFVRRRFF